MKITMKEFLELDVKALLAVNGGSSCGGAASTMESSAGTMASAGGGGDGSPMSSESHTDSTATGSGTCGGANPSGSNSGGQSGYGSDTSTDNAPTCSGTCGGTNKNATSSDASAGEASIGECAVDKLGEYYVRGENDCDIWVQDALDDAGYDISNVWGDAKSTDCKQHEENLKGKTSDVPDEGWSVVIMSDPRDGYSGEPHAGLVNVNSDGSVDVYDNSSKTGSKKETYDSISDFESSYIYSDFDYYFVSSN